MTVWSIDDSIIFFCGKESIIYQKSLPSGSLIICGWSPLARCFSLCAYVNIVPVKEQVTEQSDNLRAADCSQKLDFLTSV